MLDQEREDSSKNKRKVEKFSFNSLLAMSDEDLKSNVFVIYIENQPTPKFVQMKKKTLEIVG